MKIKRIRLKNGYKRFKDLTIDLGNNPPRIVALIGPNGCGKSSVFDGMIFLQNAWNKIGQFDIRDYKFHSMTSAPGFDYNNVEIEFDKGHFSQVIEQKRKDGTPHTVFSYRNPYRYNSNLDIKQLQALPDLINNNIGASCSVDLDDKMTANYQRLYSYIQAYLKNNDISYKTALKKVLGDLNETLKRCLSLEIVDEGDIIGGRGSLFFKKDDQLTPFSFNVLSSGEKEVVDLLLDVFLKKDTFTDTIYLIDEPELHLHTKVQRILLSEINKLVPSKCQIWIATHSIGFLHALQEEMKTESEVIFFEGNYSSELAILKPIAKTRANWLNIFRIALDDMVDLVSPKIIVYCEGHITQSLDEKIFNTIFSSKDDCLFISATNKSESIKYAGVALTVINKAFKDVSIRNLVDRDNKCSIPKESSVIICPLKRLEFENYLFDYEIIHKSFSSVTRDNYDAIVSDIINNDIKPHVLELMVVCNPNLKDVNSFKETLAASITPDTKIYQELHQIIFENT